MSCSYICCQSNTFNGHQVYTYKTVDSMIGNITETFCFKQRNNCFKPLTLERMTTQKQLTVKNSGMISPLVTEERDEEMTRSALAAFRAREEEIEKRKSEVKEKVQAQLGRVEEETKRLAEIREELEALIDPMRKEVSVLCKRVDLINRDLVSMRSGCQKKEKEYKDALEAFNDKNKEKGQLIGKLVELVGESEKLRMKKLDELCKNIESLR